jgi:uncharacterized membrane protein
MWRNPLFYLARNVLIITLIGFGITVPAKAVETLLIDEMPSHCIHYVENSGSNVGFSSLRFVNNFIDGAVATDEHVIKEHFWIDLAVQTDVGNRFNRYGSPFYAKFSLNAPVPLADMLYRLTTIIQNNPLKYSLISVRGLAYLTPSSHYPRKIDLADTNS